MSNYTITTNFGAKDSLPSGNAGKVIKGSEFTTEFTNIQTSIATKADTAGDTFTGAVTFDAAVTLNSTATITGDLTVDTNTLFVDVSADKVGIGTASPAQKLHISGGSTAAIVRIQSDGVTRIDFGDNSDSDAGRIEYVHSAHAMRFSTDNTERMRIDSSGRVLVGTTDTSIYDNASGGNTGFVYSPNHLLQVARQTTTNTQSVMNLNKMGVDGNIIELYKDGSTVGSIGNSSTRLFAGSGATGLMYDGSNNYIVPWNTSTNAGRDGAIDLGVSTFRFKDLHLSGTGYFGTSVGIGTTSPDSVLTIDKDVSTAYDSSVDDGQRSNTNTLLLKNEDGTANSFAQIAFDLGASNQPIARIAGINTGTSSSALAFVVEGSNVKREAMRIDSSGKVGIGATSPSNPLHLKAATNIPALIETTHSGGNSRLRFITASGTDWSLGSNNNGNFTLFDAVNNNNCFTVEAGAGANTLVIDSNSRVGIGTDSPTHALTVGDVNAETTIGVAGNRSQFGFKSDLAVVQGGSGKGIQFNVNNNTFGSGEAMRIKSSGKLLIGKTDESAINTVGIEAHPAGLLVATRDSNIPLIANRKTNRGTLVQLRTDNNVAGQIGVETNNYLYIGNADTNLAFSSSSDLIFPRGTDGATRDGAIDLGNSANRFKDFYLSGGVYLGGTGSANKLDDYEEGTWTMSVRDSESTPNVSSSTNSGCRYIKVGNKVTIEGLLLDINKGSLANSALKITGFPFTIKSTGSTRPHGAIQVNNFSGAQVERGLYVQGQANGTHALIKSNVTATGASSVSASALDSGNTSDIFFSLTYIAE